MIYQTINSKVIIARVINNFNISNSDWIPRTPDLILRALREIIVSRNLKVVSLELACIDYMVELPCDLESLEGIFHTGERIPVTTYSDMETNEISYESNNNGFVQIKTDNLLFQDTTVIVKYKGYVLELDPQYNLYMPIIPDNEELIEAISYYILIHGILTRGYRHPVYNLESNSPITNAEVKYSGINGKGGLKLKARLSVSKLNKDEYRKVSNSLNSLVTNRNSFNYE